MSESKITLLCLAGLVALAIGAGVPMIFIDVKIYGSTMERSQSVIYIAALFFTVFSFNRIGVKHQKLKEWSTNTFFGVICMLFLAGFLISLFGSSYMLLPFPSWLHLSISVIIGLIASGCMFIMLAQGNNDESS
jgi:hypothetical protein